MGLCVNEASQSQTAEWQNQQGQAIRVGSNFVSVSPRTVNVTLVYWSDVIDVSPYAEACASLMEIGAGDATPPRLHYQQGLLRMIPCECTSFSPKYENPFPGTKGFRQVTVELGFKLLGGADSPHKLAAPLVETRLQQEKKKTNLIEYAKLGKALVLEDTLMHCLQNQQDQSILKTLVENKKDEGNDPEKWKKLTSDGLVQAATAGLIPPAVLKDQGLQDQLKRSLAATIASKTYGLRKAQQSGYAMALSGLNVNIDEPIQGSNHEEIIDDYELKNTYGIQEALFKLASAQKPDFERIYKAIIDQDLASGSTVFNGSTGETIIRSAGCGLEYRAIGATRVAPTAANDVRSSDFWKKVLGKNEKLAGSHDKYLLEKINSLLRSSPTDEQIKKQFGLTSPEQIAALKSGGQYQSVDQFQRYLSTGSNGIAGYAVYQNFLKYQIDKELGPDRSDPVDTTGTPGVGG